MRERLDQSGFEEEAGPSACPVTLCLLTCLFDVQARSSRSAAFLEAALAHLGHHVQPCDCMPLDGGPHPRALAACLEYILPEVSVRSEAAAEQILRAIDVLMSEGPSYTADRYGRSVRPH